MTRAAAPLRGHQHRRRVQNSKTFRLFLFSGARQAIVASVKGHPAHRRVPQLEGYIESAARRHNHPGNGL